MIVMMAIACVTITGCVAIVARAKVQLRRLELEHARAQIELANTRMLLGEGEESVR